MRSFIPTFLVAAAAAVSAAPVAQATAYAAPTIGYSTGFNLGSQKSDGSCKTPSDWATDFSTIKGWSTSGFNFDTVKLFSTNDCDALKNAVPAAIAAKIKIWAGVWPTDDNKFNAEKAALESAIRQYGSAWLSGINVGSEALYRNDLTGEKLAQQIYDVKGMVQIALGAPQVPVGCADTWTMWVHPNSTAVRQAVDVVLMNGFPYWQGSTIEKSKEVFFKSIADTKAAIGNKPFMVGETGWPTVGPNFVSPDTPGTGPAVASTANLQRFWKESACALQAQRIPFYFFSALNEPQRESAIEQNFGVATSQRNLKISLAC